MSDVDMSTEEVQKMATRAPDLDSHKKRKQEEGRFMAKKKRNSTEEFVDLAGEISAKVDDFVTLISERKTKPEATVHTFSKYVEARMNDLPSYLRSEAELQIVKVLNSISDSSSFVDKNVS